MRLIVVPLSFKTSMLYCQKTALPAARKTPRIDDKLVARAAKTWETWQKSDSKLKKTIISWANIAMERISYEEWSLKTIPAQSAIKRKSINPLPHNEEDPHHITLAEFKKHDLSTSDLERIEVIYPQSIISSTEVNRRLHLLAHRGVSHHTKYFWISAIGAPLTLPVALLPVIPNLPGFYLLFRAWSNWKAVEGGKHLTYLLKDDHLDYQNDEQMDKMFSTLKQNKTPSTTTDELLLDEEHIEELTEKIGAKEMAPELHRALRQIKRKLNPTT